MDEAFLELIEHHTGIPIVAPPASALSTFLSAKPRTDPMPLADLVRG